MSNKISLLIHGPFSEQWLSQISKQIERASFEFDKIIIVSYETDKGAYGELLEKSPFKALISLVTIKDLLNPGFFNINRQLVSINAGLNLIDPDSIVLKLRNDQSVNFNKLIPYFDEIKGGKILTTNCFSRKDRPYHPSDMFLCAKYSVIRDYYSMPLMSESQLDIELKVVESLEKDPTLKFLPISPESELCKHYLVLKGWKIEGTFEDSMNALKKYFVIVNSWNIDFRWAKKRTHCFGKDALILPHFFKTAPFRMAMVENVKCIMAHEIQSSCPSLKDIFFIFLSKLVWSLWPQNLEGIRSKLSRKK
ncbi:MAG: hypothetical protein A2007_02285 [Verrucomicrobia bacterium GWC2_42_7]|nr:MAG: hypothetical protein A2007_02285 [Verrucomicrobia bacterium GWC2_42_7]